MAGRLNMLDAPFDLDQAFPGHGYPLQPHQLRLLHVLLQPEPPDIGPNANPILFDLLFLHGSLIPA